MMNNRRMTAGFSGEVAGKLYQLWMFLCVCLSRLFLCLQEEGKTQEEGRERTCEGNKMGIVNF
ncbi:hypothetical protein Hanom_Chr16g01511851 [Helianthus anomalus]